MKKFLNKCLLIFGILFSIGIIGLIIPESSIKENLHYTIFDKHNLLEKPSGKSRIILAGGSNVSFGINSKTIQDTFDVPVVNTAIHAGYGLKYILDDLLPFIKKGDIVILAPEYSHFLNEYFYGSKALVNTVNINPHNLGLLNLKQWSVVLSNLPKHALLKIKGFLSKKNKETSQIDSYHRNAFNEFGDAIHHWDNPKTHQGSYPQVGDFNAEVITYLINFEKQINELGAKLYVTFPSLNTPSFNDSQKAISEIHQALKNSGLTLLGDPKKYSFTPNLHFDTHYHLNGQGVKIRTDLLINDLRKFLLPKN